MEKVNRDRILISLVLISTILLLLICDLIIINVASPVGSQPAPLKSIPIPTPDNALISCYGKDLYAYIPYYLVNNDTIFVLYHGNLSGGNHDDTWRLYSANKSTPGKPQYVFGSRCYP